MAMIEIWGMAAAVPLVFCSKIVGSMLKLKNNYGVKGTIERTLEYAGD